MSVEKETDVNLAPYLRQAHATFRNGFEEDEMKHIFLRNTFEEISGSEVRFCLDKSLSFCLQEMLRDTDLELSVKFLNALSGKWLEIVNSSCGSHVVQTILGKVIADYASKKLLQTNSVDDVCEFVSHCTANSDALSDMMKDPHASHVFRSIFQILGGILLKEYRKSEAKDDIVIGKSEIPKKFTRTLKSICALLQEMAEQELLRILGNPHGSPCIGLIIEVLNKRGLMKTLGRFCEKVMSCFNDDSVVIMMKDKHVSHMFEKVLQFGSTSSKSELRKVLLSDEKRFFELSAHAVANFVVQRLVTSATDSDDFKEIFDFLSLGFEDVLVSQNYGIIQKLCEQCVRFPAFQKMFYDKILEAFHCKEIEQRSSLVLLLATLRTYDSLFDSKEGGLSNISSIEYHGAVLLQELLKFENIGLIIRSMGTISTSHIETLACDSSGSHFIDSFLTSRKLKFKIRKALVEKVADGWCKISCNKYGSRVVENFWDVSDIAIKRVLIKFLVKNAEELSKNEYGKFVYRKVQIKRYQTRLEEWETVQKQICNKRKLFADVLSETSVAKTVKK